jgi:hypothetical protein
LDRGRRWLFHLGGLEHKEEGGRRKGGGRYERGM